MEDDAVETLWIETRSKDTTLLVCNVYCPPDAKVAWIDDFATMMEKAAEEKLDRLVLGDLTALY